MNDPSSTILVVLVVAGILFILLAIAGRFDITIRLLGYLNIPQITWGGRLSAGTFGGLLLITGLLLYFLPISSQGNAPLPLGTPTVVPSLTLTTAPSPPPTPTLDPSTAVIGLMDQEVSAAENHDLALVDQIYTSDAVVKDNACQSGDQKYTWSGRVEIKARYHDLPQFQSLKHNIKQVTLIPNDFRQ